MRKNSSKPVENPLYFWGGGGCSFIDKRFCGQLGVSAIIAERQREQRQTMELERERERERERGRERWRERERETESHRERNKNSKKNIQKGSNANLFLAYCMS